MGLTLLNAKSSFWLISELKSLTSYKFKSQLFIIAILTVDKTEYMNIWFMMIIHASFQWLIQLKMFEGCWVCFFLPVYFSSFLVHVYCYSHSILDPG